MLYAMVDSGIQCVAGVTKFILVFNAVKVRKIKSEALFIMQKKLFYAFCRRHFPRVTMETYYNAVNLKPTETCV